MIFFLCFLTICFIDNDIVLYHNINNIIFLPFSDGDEDKKDFRGRFERSHDIRGRQIIFRTVRTGELKTKKNQQLNNYQYIRIIPKKSKNFLCSFSKEY